MHIPHSRRVLSFATAVTLSLALSACSDSNTHPEEIDTTEAQLRAHYEALVLALQTELSDLRGDAYITNETLQNRVDALEAVLESLGAHKPPEEETGVVTENVPETQTETDPATEPQTEAETQTEAQTETETETEAKIETESETEPPSQNVASERQYLYTESNGEATIIGYLYDSTLLSDGHLAIPTMLGGYPVTSIADNAFAGLPVTYVMLPSTLTHIGWFAFSGCLELHVLAVPDTVVRIDYGAFENCPNLTVYCPRGSYAARYTAACAVPYVET